MIELSNMIIFLIIAIINGTHSSKVLENDKVVAEEVIVAERNNSEHSEKNIRKIDGDLTNIVKCLDQSPQYRRRPDKVKYCQLFHKLSTLSQNSFSL